MVADQLVGLMAEIHLGELRKALELARSNRSSVWLAVRPVFERIAGEIGQSPEFARETMHLNRAFHHSRSCHRFSYSSATGTSRTAFCGIARDLDCWIPCAVAFGWRIADREVLS
jgi:hypothetical protein